MQGGKIRCVAPVVDVLESPAMIYLASNSPRRRQLMAVAGWTFQVVSAPVDESVLLGETPAVYVRRLAEAKAQAALAVLPPDASGWVAAADTTVADVQASGFEILGKPTDAADARRMLRQLRGRTHQVYTGLAVLRLFDQARRSAVVATDVPMRAYTEAEIEAYIASGDPQDKAGAYAIQHPVFRPAPFLRGCYPNVVGLPVCRLAALLADLDGPAPADAQAFSACPADGQPWSDIPCLLYRRVIGEA